LVQSAVIRHQSATVMRQAPMETCRPASSPSGCPVRCCVRCAAAGSFQSRCLNHLGEQESGFSIRAEGQPKDVAIRQADQQAEGLQLERDRAQALRAFTPVHVEDLHGRVWSGGVQLLRLQTLRTCGSLTMHAPSKMAYPRTCRRRIGSIRRALCYFNAQTRAHLAENQFQQVRCGYLPIGQRGPREA
jgi:hypothetical protein